MSFKAQLKVILTANDTVVAEVEDALLWQRVLTAINQGGSGPLLDTAAPAPAGPTVAFDAPPRQVDDPVGKFAQAVGVPREVVEGACSPAAEPPFLHLDMHCWEEMKRQTPERGPTAVSPMALAATLLALWFRAANLGNATQAQAQGVLRTINMRDQNASRGIQRADWLQARSGGVIVLNPAQASKAIALARAFSTKDWKGVKLS